MYFPYCTKNGSSSPCSVLHSRICSGVAESPSAIVAGSPGAMYRRKKIRRLTPISTGIIANSRFTIYLAIVGPPLFFYPRRYPKISLNIATDCFQPSSSLPPAGMT